MTRRLALLIFVLVGAQKCDSQELTPDSSRFDATSEIIRATNIANRATKMISQLQYYRALMLLDKAYSIVSAAKGKSDPLSGAALYVKAEVTRSMGMHAEAALLYQRALSVLEMYPGAYHSMLANTLDGYALVLWTQGLSNKARLHHERGLAIREQALGPTHLDVAISLDNLATTLEAMGHYDEARLYLERGLAIREQALGPTHPDVAISLDNLATTLVAMGHYNDARLYLERGLAIREATLGPDHPIVARSINDLADFIALMDDYDQALPLYERALAILEIALGPNHRSVANSLNKIALLHHESGSYAAARPLYERALAIREAALSPSHDAIAVSVNNLAALLHASGNLSEAKQMFERALAILDAAPIPNYGSISAVSNNMGILLVDMGYLDIAIGYYERAISIRKEELKLDHLYAQSTNNLARLYDIAGDYESAHSLYLRAVRIYEAHWAQVLPSLSFAEQLAFIGRNNHVITSALLSSSRAPIDLFIYYPFVARWKGLLLHSLRTQTAVNALATDPAYSQDVSALQAARANLVALQDRMSTLSLADWQARRDELTAEKERLERILAAALPEGVFTDPLRADDYPGLPVYLKPGEAFADVFRYGYRERGRFVEHRYAIVLSWDSTIVLQTASGANPVLIDLGNADELEAAVAAWRSAVTFERSAATVQSALAERLWAPLATALPEGTTRLWFSPDGALARLPLSVLAEDDQRTADLRVTQVTSARAFVRLRTSERDADREGFLLAGGLDFGTDSTGAALPWQSLPGTTAEVDALATFADDVDLPTIVLTGTDADPTTVTAALPEARYVHLATHGFFATLDQAVLDSLALRGAQSTMRGLSTDDDGFGRSKVLSQRPTTADERRALSRNPLVESGLALSGANAGSAGTLTAEELVGLDLRGTELVVLSACETGRGSEVSGQGVMGLQASFLAAGARTLLMSLWKVPDVSTAVLMEAFYRGLWEDDLTPAAALHAAQATVRESGYREPVHWAGWVLAGEAW